LAASPALANDLFVRDGDSFAIDGQEVRLWGIDAPEYHQICFKDGKSTPCGKYSRQRLENLMKNEQLQCERVDIDRYKRIVARCYIQGEDLAALMVRAGFAFDYPRYSKGAYSKQQKAAKNELRGLWSMDFEMPWIWKRKK
jgi:endonuclease YncB( thermonuclease family)